MYKDAGVKKKPQTDEKFKAAFRKKSEKLNKILLLQQLFFANSALKRVKTNNEDFIEDFVPEEDADEEEPVFMQQEQDFRSSSRIDDSLSALKGVSGASM